MHAVSSEPQLPRLLRWHEAPSNVDCQRSMVADRVSSELRRLMRRVQQAMLGVCLHQCILTLSRTETRVVECSVGVADPAATRQLHATRERHTEASADAARVVLEHQCDLDGVGERQHLGVAEHEREDALARGRAGREGERR